MYLQEFAQLNISEFDTTAKPQKDTITSSVSASSSTITTSSFETYSSTVVSQEVTSSATKLTASSSLNPFDAVPELPNSSAPFALSDASSRFNSATVVSELSNPFTTTSTMFEESVPIHPTTLISASSSSVVTSSSTTIITTDLYEVTSTNNGSVQTTASATVFDALIAVDDHLVDDTIDFNDVPPLPSIPPPQSVAQPATVTNSLENHPDNAQVPKAAEAPKKEMFTL